MHIGRHRSRDSEKGFLCSAPHVWPCIITIFASRDSYGYACIICVSKRRFKLAIQCLCVSFLKTREASTLLYISGVRSKSKHGQNHQLERRGGGDAAPSARKTKTKTKTKKKCTRTSWATCVLVLDHMDMTVLLLDVDRTRPRGCGGATAPPKAWPPHSQKIGLYWLRKKIMYILYVNTCFLSPSYPLLLEVYKNKSKFVI